jgi:TfoX/Sxy family transcriptional regulator of competence genes
MASNTDLVQYIVDQCSGAGEIAVRKMMGDYCIYCDGILFGLICDNNLYVKPTYQGAARLKDVVMDSPYPGAKEHFLIDDVDDRDSLVALIKATLPALPQRKSRKNPMLERKKYVPASLDETIPQGIVCSQELRAFFQQYLGTGFRFKVGFQKWLNENAGKTYRDAVEVYKNL